MSKPSRSSNPLLHPFRSLRRWLKRIDRQSANRRGGPWTRATEYALVLSLPIAGVLSFIVDELGVTVSSTPIARIHLGRDRIDGPLIASVVPVDADRAPWRIPIPVAEIMVERRTIRHGWPFAGRIVQTEPIAIASPFVAPDERIDISDPEAVDRIEALTLIDLDGAWKAAAVALDTDPAREKDATDFRESRRIEIRSWPTTLALFGVLWILLFVVSAALIRMLQFTSWLAARARRNRMVKRLRNGECPGCRYDLRAERFPQRCPECGLRIWA